MDITELRRQVLACARQSYTEGLFAGTSGNLSARDPESGLIAITPTSVPYPTMTADDIVVMDLDGNVVQGGRPSSEWPMHAELYRAMPEVHAVVHTHSPCATGFAVVQRPIPVILIEMIYFLHGAVPVADYARPGSPQVGKNCVKALLDSGATACLMANHGVAAVGETLDQAHIRAVYVEDAARIYQNARLVGEPVLIPVDEQNEMRRRAGLAEVEA